MKSIVIVLLLAIVAAIAITTTETIKVPLVKNTNGTDDVYYQATFTPNGSLAVGAWADYSVDISKDAGSKGGLSVYLSLFLCTLHSTPLLMLFCCYSIVVSWLYVFWYVCTQFYFFVRFSISLTYLSYLDSLFALSLDSNNSSASNIFIYVRKGAMATASDNLDYLNQTCDTPVGQSCTLYLFLCSFSCS